MAAAEIALLDRFYDAFAKHDGVAMAACYAPSARFDDPAFPGLHGDEPGLMWRMLTERGADLTVEQTPAGRVITIRGEAELKPQHIVVPGDPSSAAEGVTWRGGE